MKRPLTGFAQAVTKIRSSDEPLAMWWRPVLKGNAVNEILAIPAHHRRPTAGILVGLFSGNTPMPMIKAQLEIAMARYAHAEQK